VVAVLWLGGLDSCRGWQDAEAADEWE
jgi:hypothetical protein